MKNNKQTKKCGVVGVIGGGVFTLRNVCERESQSFYLVVFTKHTL